MRCSRSRARLLAALAVGDRRIPEHGRHPLGRLGSRSDIHSRLGGGISSALVERGNNDVVVFILVVCGSLLWSVRYGHRVVAYGLYLLAGLLKYYPLVLLI